MLVFENVKPLEGSKENGDAVKARSQERGSNLSVFNRSKGSSSAGTWLETRLLQTKCKMMGYCYEPQLASERKDESVSYYTGGGKQTWIIQ